MTTMMSIHLRHSPQAEYRRARSEKVAVSESLAKAFPRLKSLQADIEFFDSKGVTRMGGMSVRPNVEHAKALFHLNCMHTNCVGGDYDLSETLRLAILAKRKDVAGELRCYGMQHNPARKDTSPCQAILRYKLKLVYQTKPSAKK